MPLDAVKTIRDQIFLAVCEADCKIRGVFRSACISDEPVHPTLWRKDRLVIDNPGMPARAREIGPIYLLRSSRSAYNWTHSPAIPRGLRYTRQCNSRLLVRGFQQRCQVVVRTERPARKRCDSKNLRKVSISNCYTIFMNNEERSTLTKMNFDEGCFGIATCDIDARRWER